MKPAEYDSREWTRSIEVATDNNTVEGNHLSLLDVVSESASDSDHDGPPDTNEPPAQILDQATVDRIYAELSKTRDAGEVQAILQSLPSTIQLDRAGTLPALLTVLSKNASDAGTNVTQTVETYLSWLGSTQGLKPETASRLAKESSAAAEERIARETLESIKARVQQQLLDVELKSLPLDKVLEQVSLHLQLVSLSDEARQRCEDLIRRAGSGDKSAMEILFGNGKSTKTAFVLKPESNDPAERPLILIEPVTQQYSSDFSVFDSKRIGQSLTRLSSELQTNTGPKQTAQEVFDQVREIISQEGRSPLSDVLNNNLLVVYKPESAAHQPNLIVLYKGAKLNIASATSDLYVLESGTRIPIADCTYRAELPPSFGVAAMNDVVKLMSDLELLLDKPGTFFARQAQPGNGDGTVAPILRHTEIGLRPLPPLVEQRVVIGEQSVGLIELIDKAIALKTTESSQTSERKSNEEVLGKLLELRRRVAEGDPSAIKELRSAVHEAMKGELPKPGLAGSGGRALGRLTAYAIVGSVAATYIARQLKSPKESR